MSDYLFSSVPQSAGTLTSAINSIYHSAPPNAKEYHGEWGTLAVSQGHYAGFQPYETDQHLMVVVGGPVLYFRDNDFLTSADSFEATRAIYRRWQIDGSIKWDEDLSGPFTILLVDKVNRSLIVITDLMAFIPVYFCQKNGTVHLGTHIDALAETACETGNLDPVSLADFVLNDVITYPYTAYRAIRQLPPSSEIRFSSPQAEFTGTSYWVPEEANPYSRIQEAADALREGLNGYIGRITANMGRVAQFVSAGEDSRALSGMLPERLQRDAYIFLDHMNREGRIAERVASIYGANFIAGFRSRTHYLEILPEGSRLVGSGHQYIHAHSLHFDKAYKLADYPAVFGGYLSDSLLKAAYARNYLRTRHYSFIPGIFRRGEARTKPVNHPAIKRDILAEVNSRRKARFAEVQEERPITAHEWFVLRPATMRVAIPNLYTTRRLFRSYEPFMCKEAIKISAAVPTPWKMNRRLFNTAMKPYLKPSKWLLHADGRLPYFSWWVNAPVQVAVLAYWHVAKRIGLIKGNQGPWGDWLQTCKSPEWGNAVEQYTMNIGEPAFLQDGQDVRELLTSDSLSLKNRVNLLQTYYQLQADSKACGCWRGSPELGR